MLNVFLNWNRPKPYEPISPLGDDICLEIFRRVAGNFEVNNLNKLAVCQLTSKKVYPLIEPLWKLIRKEIGMNVSWQVCIHTTFPETYNWMLNQRFLTLIQSAFKTQQYQALVPNIRLTVKALENCEFLLKKSSLLAQNFSIIAHQNPLIFTKWEKLKETVSSFSSTKKETSGEQILQLYVGATEARSGNFNIGNLKKFLKTKNSDELSFLMKTFLSLGRLYLPLLEKGVELWKSGERRCLEIMVEDIWKSSDTPSFIELLKKFYENTNNRVAPIALIHAAKLMTHLYTFAREKYLSTNQIVKSYEVDSNQTIETLIKNIEIDDLSNELLNLTLGLIKTRERLDSLDEPSPITDLFLPLFLNLSPRTDILLFEIKQKLRLKHYYRARDCFKNYLKIKYGLNPEDRDRTLELYKQMSEDEREIVHFLQLKLENSNVYILLAQRGYQKLIRKNQKFSKCILLHIRYTYGLIESHMLLGEWKNACVEIQALLKTYGKYMTPEQKNHHHVTHKTIEIFRKSPLDFAGLCEIIGDRLDFSPLGIKLIAEIPFKEEYQLPLCQLIEKHILLWKNEDKMSLELILEALWIYRKPWLLEFLVEIYKNPTFQIPPIMLLLAKAILDNHYQKIISLDKPYDEIMGESKLISTKIKILVSELMDCRILPKESLLSLLELISLHESLDPLTDCAPIDEILPLLLKIDPKPNEVILLESKLKYRAKQFDEAVSLYDTIDRRNYCVTYSDYLFRGELLCHLERHEEACAVFKNSMNHFRSTINENKDNRVYVKMFMDACLGAIKAKMKLMELNEAKKICEELAENVPDKWIIGSARQLIEKVKIQSLEFL